MRLLISTLPKSGTHLVKEVAKRFGLKRGPVGAATVEDLLAMPDGCFALGHRAYSRELADVLEANGVRMLGLVRDPRDFIVSLAHHVLRKEGGEFRAVIDSLCRGEPSRFDSFLAALYGWQTDPRTTVVRFEELVGPRGGGAEAAQLDAGRRIAELIELEISDQAIMEAVSGSYRTDVGQFRRGQIGAWRDELPKDVAEFINLRRAGVLRAWGYEPEVA